MPPLPRLPRAFHAVSLAATNIASRTTFVVCVPIASDTPSSLPGRIGFTNTLRVITALSVPHSVANGSVPTPLGHMRPPSRPPAKAGFTPIPSVRTASLAFHVSICRHAFGLSACHSRASVIPLYAFPRRSPSAQVVLSKSKPSHRGVTRSVGGVRPPWVFVPHPTNGTPMDKNANRPRTPPMSRQFTVGKTTK